MDETIETVASALRAQARDLERQASNARALADELERAERGRHNSRTTTMSIDDVIAEAGLSRFAVRRLLDEGSLAGVQVGRRVLITRASVDALTRSA